MLRPEACVTLIESHQRKAVFLREATRRIPNIRVAACRAESVTRPFEWVICRAVRYEEISPVLSTLAPRVALLTGAADPAKLLGFAWEPPIPLPWGEHRLLLLGRREP